MSDKLKPHLSVGVCAVIWSELTERPIAEWNELKEKERERIVKSIRNGTFRRW